MLWIVPAALAPAALLAVPHIGASAAVALGILLMLLPAGLALRQLVRPAQEPVAPWPNSLLAPGLAGAATGLAGWLVFHEVDTCPGECLGSCS